MAFYKITEQKLLPADTEIHPGFGFSVDLSGDSLAVGVIDPEDETGHVFLYDRSGAEWDQTDRLDAPEGGRELLGSSLALDGQDLAVGADMYGNLSSRQGSAYLYQGDTDDWALSGRLVGCDETGYIADTALALQGGRLVVGNPRAGEFLDFAGDGAVDFYQRWQVGWVRNAHLTSGYTDAEQFGQSVSLSADTLAVGGGHDPLGLGAVHLFGWIDDAWVLEDLIVESRESATGTFGETTALDGDYLLIGSPAEADQQGAAYLYQRGSPYWAQQARLVAEDGVAGDEFGAQVALAGDYAAVAAPQHAEGVGAVYLFQRNPDDTNWLQIVKLVASDGSATDTFGIDLAIQTASDGNGVELLVGAPVDSDTGINGAAYHFTLKLESTVVTLVSFEANATENGARVEWVTATEPDSVGFHIWRSKRLDDDYQRISQAIIPSQGGMSTGAEYVFIDDSTTPGESYAYRLEDFAADGSSMQHGPAYLVGMLPGDSSA